MKNIIKAMELYAYIDKPMLIGEGETVTVRTGVGIPAPEGYHGVIVESRDLKARGLKSETYECKPGEMGEYWVDICNLSKIEGYIQPREKIGELRFVRNF